MERKLILVMLLLGMLHGYKSCNQIERKALLELKKYLVSLSTDYGYDYVLPTWTNDTKSDCCLWKGLECNPTSGRVIGISFGEMKFKKPSLLNLSLLHPFEEVQSLNLSAFGDNHFNGFSRDVRGLSLSPDGYNPFIGFFDDVRGYKSLKKLRNLKILDLSTNKFNSSIIPFLNAATSLTTLSLRNSYMEGSFPAKQLKDLKNLELLDLSRNILNGSVSELTHLKNLKALDLSYNQFSSSTELRELKNLSSLEVLSLARNYFDGPIPKVVCEMNNLRELNLRGNYFVAQLPLCLGSLNKLQFLDLSSNQLSGNLPSSFNNLESLKYLSLSENNFTGLFSLNPLTNLTNLKVFKLSSTSKMIQVDTESSWQPKFQLNVVVLRFCNLVKIPSFLLHQKSLHLVDLSSNVLSGNVPTWLLENNPELEVLKLQNNSFTIFHVPTTMVHNLQFLDLSANEIGGLFLDNIGRALPNLVHLNASNNALQGHFPSSMGEMKSISYLDLSYNNLSGKLPRNFVTGCLSLKYLKLSHNRFSGHFLPGETSFISMQVLRLDNNLFSGKIGIGLLNSTILLALDMSNNCLTGAIPSWLSKLSYLDILLLSDNFLEGKVPPSLMLPSFLDISGNLLSGALPHVRRLFPSSLILHNNNFTGPIPDTLLENVQVLDLRNNKLSGSIPQFLNTEDIGILLLRGNNLTGSIPRKLCDLRSIRLLDLSENKLNDSIPSCLYNSSIGLGGEKMRDFMYNPAGIFLPSLQVELYKSTFVVEMFEVSYGIFHAVEIEFAMKKRYDFYSGISEFSLGILDSLYGIDLSNNQLSGIIPAEFGDLSKLRVMNLSHNFLSSSIPSSFSNLKDIESLDLSYNMLHGSIPHQLTSLTSLAVFNVSYNNLSEMIPKGKQFNTFDETSYLGNPLLCGPPTIRSCEAKKSSEEAYHGGQEEEEEDDEGSIDMLVFYFSTASTYVTVLIGILVLKCFDCPWSRAWLRIIDAFIASAKSILP